mgnify:CR=1 FL=1
MIENTLWCEKYRPKNLDDYVGSDDFVGKVRLWIEKQDIPHLLLYSADPGTGKTTAAKIIGNLLDADVLYINASDENNIDTVRDKIKNFASSVGFGSIKIIILDEADYLTPNAMAALRNVIETFSKHTRFILTCNYPERIIAPLQSRLISFHIQPPDRKSVAIRAKVILDQENIKFDLKDIIGIVNQYYPDQRRIINTLQRNSVTGELIIDNQSQLISGYCEKILDQLKSGLDVKNTFTNIRQIIADSKTRQFDDLFRFLFDHLEEFAGEGKRAQMILHIADCQNKSALVIDKEIQVAAMFINILRDLKHG